MVPLVRVLSAAKVKWSCDKYPTHLPSSIIGQMFWQHQQSGVVRQAAVHVFEQVAPAAVPEYCTNLLSLAPQVVPHLSTVNNMLVLLDMNMSENTYVRIQKVLSLQL